MIVKIALVLTLAMCAATVTAANLKHRVTVRHKQHLCPCGDACQCGDKCPCGTAAARSAVKVKVK